MAVGIPSFIIMIGTMGVISIADDGGLGDAGEPALAMMFASHEEATTVASSLPMIDDSKARVVNIDIDPRLAEIQILVLMIEYYKSLMRSDAEALEGFLKEYAIKSYALGLVDSGGFPTQSDHPLQ